ncbi:hypothetical protein ACR6C2_40790 [Streptomyces sp. INA 01156]
MNDKELRARLVERLTGSGHLRTEPWSEAVSAVPRHEFLRGGFFREVDGSTPTAWTRSCRTIRGGWRTATTMSPW